MATTNDKDALKREECTREQYKRERNRQHARISRERKRVEATTMVRENQRLRTYIQSVEAQNDDLRSCLEAAQYELYVGVAEVTRLREFLFVCEARNDFDFCVPQASFWLKSRKRLSDFGTLSAPTLFPPALFTER